MSMGKPWENPRKNPMGFIKWTFFWASASEKLRKVLRFRCHEDFCVGSCWGLNHHMGVFFFKLINLLFAPLVI